MKSFIFVCLLAAAMAAPEADPQVVYSGYPWAYGAYPYSAYGYASPYLSYRLFKREAEAEADPQLLYAAGYPLAYSAAAYSYPYAATYAAAPFVYGRGYYANSGGAVHIAKREAEADPQIFYGAHPYAYPYAYGYSNVAAYANPFVFGRGYYANSGGAVHIAKREAEADPQVFYGAYPYTYPYAYTAAAGLYPYSSAYRLGFPYLL